MSQADGAVQNMVLSFLIEADQKILFDTGSTDLISYNAQILNIDLQQISTIVLSHGHDDQ